MSEQIPEQIPEPAIDRARAGARETAPLFETNLEPHRSLSPKGFSILIWAMAAVGFVQGAAFMMIGAWPVVGFAGVEWLLFWFLFRRHFRGDLRSERIVLYRDLLIVETRDAKGRAARLDWQPYWLRVELEERPPFSNALVLSSHGRRAEIARFLGPEQRRSLSHVLKAELRRANNPA